MAVTKVGFVIGLAKLRIQEGRNRDVIERFLAWIEEEDITLFQHEAYMKGHVLGVFIRAQDVEKVQTWLDAQEGVEMVPDEWND